MNARISSEQRENIAMRAGVEDGTITTEPKHEIEDEEVLSLSIQLQKQILNQLQRLVELQSQPEANAPIVYDALYNTLLQIIGLAGAAIFGAFSILGWQLAHAGNDLASESNQLAMNANELTMGGNCAAMPANLVGILDFCQSNKDLALGVCAPFTSELVYGSGVNSQIFTALNETVSQAVRGLGKCYTFGTGGPGVGGLGRCCTSDTGGPDLSEADGASLSAGVNVGVAGFGALLLVALLALRFMSYREKRRRMMSRRAKNMVSRKKTDERASAVLS
ncbi:hypothetical protein F4859DRAFT_394265 [Xylaria cf. heliscus]|nr:hypothetical protein F4859DRAFT_394265 [Xylaria cf. heliscus]